MSAWSGIRPLVKDPNKEDTQSLVRNHVIHVSPSNMVTIAGGKWTTYRYEQFCVTISDPIVLGPWLKRRWMRPLRLANCSLRASLRPTACSWRAPTPGRRPCLSDWCKTLEWIRR